MLLFSKGMSQKYETEYLAKFEIEQKMISLQQNVNSELQKTDEKSEKYLREIENVSLAKNLKKFIPENFDIQLIFLGITSYLHTSILIYSYPSSDSRLQKKIPK